MTITTGIRDTLRAAASVTSLLGTFAGKAAIFERDAAPVGFKIGDDGACIIIGAAIAAPNEDTFEAYRSQELYRIRCYAPQGAEKAQKLAEAVKSALHDKLMAVAGFEIGGMTATRPVGAPTSSPSVEGRLVTLNIHLKEI